MNPTFLLLVCVLWFTAYTATTPFTLPFPLCYFIAIFPLYCQSFSLMCCYLPRIFLKNCVHYWELCFRPPFSAPWRTGSWLWILQRRFLFMTLTLRLFRCAHDCTQFSVSESVLSSVTKNRAQCTADFFLSNFRLGLGPGSTHPSSYRQEKPRSGDLLLADLEFKF